MAPFPFRAALGRNAAPPPVVTNGAHAEPGSPQTPTASTAGSVAVAPAPERSPTRPFVWERNWVPVAPVNTLDPSRPSPVMLLGQPLVVWRHAVRGWVVMRDLCPHRLAPLSGRRGGVRGAGRGTSVPPVVGRTPVLACSSLLQPLKEMTKAVADAEFACRIVHLTSHVSCSSNNGFFK
jgi:hypothetical protein